MRSFVCEMSVADIADIAALAKKSVSYRFSSRRLQLFLIMNRIDHKTTTLPRSLRDEIGIKGIRVLRTEKDNL